MRERRVKAYVESITPLTDSIMRLLLAPEYYVDYHAGQYLQILFGEEAFSYSIANAPLGSHKYELHIRHSLENSYTQPLLAHIKEHGFVTIRLPYGECYIERLNVQQRPILFIAGGTGFAPVKAMIEQLLSTGDVRPFELFWGARTQSDLYMNEKVTSWQTHVSHFKYFSSISEENKALISFLFTKHPKDLTEWQIVISGPFDMVYSIRDALVESGVSPAHLFSDAFSFEVK